MILIEIEHRDTQNGLRKFVEIGIYSTGCTPNALLWAACAQLLARTPILACCFMDARCLI
jgi:hypothetical protein